MAIQQKTKSFLLPGLAITANGLLFLVLSGTRGGLLFFLIGLTNLGAGVALIVVGLRQTK